MSEHVSEVNDQNFELQVLNSDKPVLVDFWAPWCAPCRMLPPTVEAVAQNFQGSASVVKLNVDDNPAVSDRKSTRLNSSHTVISYAVFCLKKKKKNTKKEMVGETDHDDYRHHADRVID